MGARRTVDRERVLRLARRGLSAEQIATRLGCSSRTVQRIVKEAK